MNRSAFILAAVLATVAGADVAPPPAAPPPERELADALARIGVGDLDGALAGLDALLARQPNFRLAQLARGDVLLAQAGALSEFGGGASRESEALADLRDEAVQRLAAQHAPASAEQVPAALLRLAAREPYAVVVDTARARVFVYRNDGDLPRLVADFYASHGRLGAAKQQEGDKRTPTGVYRVFGRIGADDLTDFYGAGAFPLTYPNAWDRRAGRDGFGIWLHGTPRSTYARPPRASDGCVVLANDDWRALARYIQPGRTPVVIEDGLELVTPALLRAERDGLEAAIEAWRTDWASRDTDRYLTHYARGFVSDDGLDLAAWSERKQRVNAGKRRIEVGVRELSIQRGADGIAVVTFEQDYRSDTLAGVMQKRQYWTREDGVWRIAWEGEAAHDVGRPLRSRQQMLSKGSGLEPFTRAASPPR